MDHSVISLARRAKYQLRPQPHMDERHHSRGMERGHFLCGHAPRFTIDFANFALLPLALERLGRVRDWFLIG